MEGDINMWNLVKKHCPDSGRIFCLGVGGHVRHRRHPDQARSFVLIGNKYKGLFCEVFFLIMVPHSDRLFSKKQTSL